MKRKPWPLIVLALLHILSPIGNIIVNSFLAKISVITYLQVLFTPQEMLRTGVFLLVPVLCGVLIYICKKWSYYLYLILMLIPFIYSYWSWQKQAKIYTTELSIYLILFYIINLSIVGYFVIPQVRKVYFDPRLRWWETKPRYNTEFESIVRWVDQSEKAEIKNISEGGIFVQTPMKINLQGRISIEFKFNKIEYIFNGEVVYVNKNISPEGYGISLHLNESQLVELKNLILELNKSGSLASSRAPTEQDTFSYWLKKVLKTRKGIVPEVKG